MIEIQRAEIPVSDGTKMGLHYARPVTGGGAAPGIIVFQEAWGVNSHIRSVVRRLAAEGFLAAAPELFHRTAPGFESGDYSDFTPLKPHMQALTSGTLEADAKAAFDWLAAQPDVKKEAICSIGFCVGGRASFIANSALPLKAAISFYAGGMVPDLLPAAKKQKGPILMFWGGLDSHIPITNVRAVADALTADRKSHTQVVISDADHGFFCDERSSYQPRAAADAWALSLAFLRNRLG